MLSVTGSGNGGRQRPAAWSHLIVVGVATITLALATRAAWAQPSCQDIDPQCMTNGVCQSNGTCLGSNLPDTTSCNDGDPCTTNDHCQAGHCVGGGAAPSTTICDDHNDCTTGDHCQAGQCVASGSKNTGDPCTYPGVGLCATAQCQVLEFVGAICVPQSYVQCADKCQFCDPSSGQCTANTFCGFNPCSTGACDPSTGNCVPGNEGASCNDGNECTSNDRCQNGECKGSIGGTPQPTSTVTPSPTETPTQPSGLPCVGDCNDNGYVTVDEILTMINIALDNIPVTDCEEGDTNHDDQITVDEILAAVIAALNGCTPLAPTPTATAVPPSATPGVPTNTPQPTATTGGATSTPTATGAVASPTPSSTPGGTPAGPTTAQRATGVIKSTTSAFLVIPDLLSALLGHLPSSLPGLAPAPGSGSAATTIIDKSFSCATNGGGRVTCDEDFFPVVVPPTFAVTLNGCQVAGGNGATLTFNGNLSATGGQSDTCFSIPTTPTVSIPNLTVQSQSAAGSTTATFTNVTGNVFLSCSSTPCDCRFDTVVLQLSGVLTVTAKDSVGTTLTSTQATFSNGSSISISVTQYSADGQCVPVVYSVEADGIITLTTDGNPPLQATYGSYTLRDDATSGQDMVEVSGGVSSQCFDALNFTTETDLAFGNGPCPNAGMVGVTDTVTSTTDIITYTGTGGMQINLSDGSTQNFGTCFESALFVCP